MSIQEIFNDSLTGLVGKTDGKKFLLAVSGGIDSVCMAELFYRSGLKPVFSIAHVNFSLRGEESDQDMKSVVDWGSKRGIEVYTRTFDTHAFAQEHSLSTQMAARELRYGYFNELVSQYGFDYIAVAHNENDSVETVFLNMARGTGIKGMTGIPVRNGNIIRPLLSVPRSMIADFVKENGIPYRDDRTNFESHYYRNRIRNIIIPEFEKINPSVLNTVSRNTGYIAQAAEILDEMALKVRKRLCSSEDGDVIIDTAKLKKEKHCGYWLHSILSEYGFSSGQLKEIERCITSDQTTGKMFRTGSSELVFGSSRIRIRQLTDEEDTGFLIDGPGIYTYKKRRFRISFIPASDGFCPMTDGAVLYMDADSVRFPIICRSWKTADRFRPFGMQRGSKKLADFFKDLKIDRIERQSCPVLTSEKGDILCLPGLRIDDRYKIKTSTKSIIEVSMV